MSVLPQKAAHIAVLVAVLGIDLPPGLTHDDVGQAAFSTTALAVPAPSPAWEIDGTIRINNFGWRPDDRKVAVLHGRQNARVELRRADDLTLVQAYLSGPLLNDDDSGDAYATVDFSGLRQNGTYVLALPDDHRRSYDFVVNDKVYDVVGAAAAKSYYFQRCNQARELPFASDSLLGYPGSGGQWVDGQCHRGDFAAPAGPGSADHGALDLHGGWHDAGDYQKTLWDRGVDAMLWAYEVNPNAWWDGQLNIPESGNGLADLLDEIAWELDFYLRMQRPDGHFMTSVKGKSGRTVSPPSAADEKRVYFDATSPEGNGWSGGGVTIFDATANAVLALAHAAIVFRQAGAATTADHYQQAALAGFAWLTANEAPTPLARHALVAAAAAVFRLTPGEDGARRIVEGFAWRTWGGTLETATPAENLITQTGWHTLANPAADDAVKAAIRSGLSLMVDRTFAEAGAYGGLFGGPTNGWDWGWGSNRTQSVYGAKLMMAVHFGVTANRDAEAVRDRGASYFHYLLGLNPLNMVYLTNMAAYGGEHSSFQIYHSWFSQLGSGDGSNVTYNGKPQSVSEPLYPYNPEDSQLSTYGPAPGLMPGGPNWYYSGTALPANRRFPAYAYRDWSVGCGWDGSRCASAAWEITEPAVGYQGWFLLLASFMMSAR